MRSGKLEVKMEVIELKDGQLATCNGRHYIVNVFKRKDSYEYEYELTTIKKISKPRFDKLLHISKLKQDVNVALSETKQDGGKNDK